MRFWIRKNSASPQSVSIEASLDRRDNTSLESFDRALTEMSESLGVYLVTGKYDYKIKVAVNGIRGYEEFLHQRLH